MRTQTDSSSPELTRPPKALLDTETNPIWHERAKADQLADRSAATRARHQRFGFLLFGLLCCLAAVVFIQWSPQENPGRWLWVILGSLAGVICLVRAQRRHGGVGADLDASPYYGIYSGVASGGLLLMLLTTESWVLPGVFFVIAAVLAFLAWIEQSTIGMTAAVCVGLLAAASGVAVLDGGGAVGVGTLSIGVMLLTAALALGGVHGKHETA